MLKPRCGQRRKDLKGGKRKRMKKEVFEERQRIIGIVRSEFYNAVDFDLTISEVKELFDCCVQIIERIALLE